MKASRIVSIAFVSLAVSSAGAGRICMSDGSCIEDPSLTTESAPRVDLPSGLNLESTGTWTMIQTKCSKDNYNKGTVKYASPEACLQENMAELSQRTQANVDKAKKEAGSKSGDGGGSPAGNSGGGGNQGGDQQQGGQQQADNSQQQPAEQGQGAQAASHEPVKAEDPIHMPGAGCAKAVTAHLKRCEESRAAAEIKCDPSKDKGVQASEAENADTGLLARSSQRANRGAAMSASDLHGLSGSIGAFAGSCRLGHRQCERSCLSVRKAYEKYCASAAPQEKTKAQADVAKAEGDENGKLCKETLAKKADQADQQAAVSSQTGEQHANVNDQTAGSGGGGEGMAGILGQMSQLAQQKKEEKDALKKALETAAAQEGMTQACQRIQFKDLEECVCQGLSASACAAKMPTRLPSNFDPNYLLTTPAQ